MKSLVYCSICILLCPVAALSAPIDRQALVSRHDVVLTNLDLNNPLSVGNGQFCFTVDATGLQTFPEAFAETIPLGTLSDWGWHTITNTVGWDIDNFQFKEYTDLNGRQVPYADVPRNQQTPEIKWLRSNPHRLHLGQIGFLLKHADGSLATTNDLKDVEQHLDLWNGRITSHFTFDGQPVEVETVCDTKDDAVAIRVKSLLLKSQRLTIQVRFPYGTGATTTADWSRPEAHETVYEQGKKNTGHFDRKLDLDTYVMDAWWSQGAGLVQTAPHQFELSVGASGTSRAGLEKNLEQATPDVDLAGDTKPQTDGAVTNAPENKKQASATTGTNDIPEMEFVCAFSPKVNSQVPDFDAARKEAQKHWNHFWQTGGAIDLSGSKDPRWFELERRIVLSQYLTAIQSAGFNPPQETGLTYNTWEGKFHLEMHWWHEAHFALWDRLPLLENSLYYYQKILPRAEGTAKKQGYAGARWPKMTSPSGAESPSPVGPFLIWQEPHPIFYAELCWREHHDKATLKKYRDIVFQTADFMASYATWDKATGRYVLGPVLQCAQEIFPKDKTYNPTFELTYWRWGLETAQQWRMRLGQPRNPKWDKVLSGLAKPPVAGDKYAFAETAMDSYTNPKWNADHPSVTAALGMLPGQGIDPETMRHTLNWIWYNWNWPDTWGWDYPMLAMTATRLGEPERAIEALLLDTPKNHWAVNGHVYQRPGLTLYLPANGGLLYATAMMAAGWDTASGTNNVPQRNAPGFPDNGQWTVRWENLHPAP